MPRKPTRNGTVDTEEEIPANLQVRRELTRLKKEENVRVPNLALQVAMILGAEFMEMYDTVTDAAKCCLDFSTKMQAYGLKGSRR